MSERGIDVDTQCPLCDEEVTTPLHALQDCKTIFEVLTQASIALLPSASPTSHVQQWLLDQVTLIQIFFLFFS